MKSLFIHYIASIIVLMSYSIASYAIDPIYKSGSSNVALKGYDTVSYFVESKPVKGNKQFSTEYNGAVWQFASKENLQKFILEPERYVPQFGGYCAYAVSRNTTASIKPEVYNIHEGKLYLNYNKAVQRRWLKDLKKGIKKANKNWPEILER